MVRHTYCKVCQSHYAVTFIWHQLVHEVDVIASCWCIWDACVLTLLTERCFSEPLRAMKYIRSVLIADEMTKGWSHLIFARRLSPCSWTVELVELSDQKVTVWLTARSEKIDLSLQVKSMRFYWLVICNRGARKMSHYCNLRLLLKVETEMKKLLFFFSM